MKNLINIKELQIQEIEELIKVAKDIMQAPEKYSEKCKHKKLATLFFEPSRFFKIISTNYKCRRWRSQSSYTNLN